MERILADIRQEFGHRMSTEIVPYCETLLDSIQKRLDKNDENQLQLILQLFKVCVQSQVNRLISLSIDLLRLFIREIQNADNDQIKENSITQTLKQCCHIYQKDTNLITSEVLTFIVEIAATLGPNLTINHVVDTIELCHFQIRQYLLKDFQQTNSLNQLQNKSTLKIFFNKFNPNNMELIFSTIFVTTSQLCHYFVKNKIVHKCPSNSDEHNNKASQEFIHLMLYLIKKLETKISFYCDLNWNQLEHRKQSNTSNTSNEQFISKLEIFILIKTLNCYYLKCIHFVLLTIPDAWKHMTNLLMEVIWKHLTPALVHILNPMPTKTKIHSNIIGNQPEKSTNLFFGRGTEKLHLTPNAIKDETLNTLNYNERQYMYKISRELLRLFGLESSMRPLLEALFYRIFLLPPLEQRIDSLLYLEELLHNPLLVSISISDPICLFEQSVSNSQYLDLFQIFMDAIKEASLFNNVLLNQLSLACLKTLMDTFQKIINLELITDETGNEMFSAGNNSMKCSATLKLISMYMERNRKLFERSFGRNRSNSNRSNIRMTKYTKQDCKNFNYSSIKDRIYGYGILSLKSMPFPDKPNNLKPANNISNKNLTNSGQYNDFDYKNKLNTLLSNDSLVMDPNDVPGKQFIRKQMLVRSENKNQFQNLEQKSFHCSLEDIQRKKISIDFDMNNLRLTNSESKLDLISFYELIQNNDLFDYSSDSSVFDDAETDSVSSDNNNENDHVVVDDDDDDQSTDSIDDIVKNARTNNYPIGLFAKDISLIYNTKPKNIIVDNQTNLNLFERLIARIFIRQLSEILMELAQCRNLFLVDEKIQLFASNFCKEFYQNLNTLKKCQLESDSDNCQETINLIHLNEDEMIQLKSYRNLFNNLFINADGIYLTTYMALLLNLKLFYLDYYQNDISINIPITEKSFIDEIFNYHITIYLSSNFISEIFQSILSNNLLALIYDHFPNDFHKLPLIKFLLDIDVLDIKNPNAFKLSDYVRLEQVAQGNIMQIISKSNVEYSNRIQNEKNPLNLLVKRVCEYFWDSLITILSQALHKNFTFHNLVQYFQHSDYNKNYINHLYSTFNCSNKDSLAQCKNNYVSIDIILSLFDICNSIHLYKRIDSLYYILHGYIVKFWNKNGSNALLDKLTLPETNNNNNNNNEINYFNHSDNIIQTKMKNLKKSFSSNDVQHSAIEKQAISYREIVALKKLLTTSTRIGGYCPGIWKHVLALCKFITDMENFAFRSHHSTLLSRAKVSFNTLLKTNSNMFRSTEYNNVNFDHYQNLYDSNAFNNFPGISEAEYTHFEQQFDKLLNEINEKQIDIASNGKVFEQIVEFFVLLVARIFETVPLKCNLSLLNNFIQELCEYSRLQLKDEKYHRLTLTDSTMEYKPLMLYRLGEVMLRFVRSGRPLLHFMKIWPIVSLHLLQAATHKNVNISKKAIISLHDIINAFLSTNHEKYFFHINESLFKSYEKLLRFEMCNLDLQQELVLYSICEFVEGIPKEIHSGWKSIFKALKGLRLSITEQQKTFTNTNNDHSSFNVRIIKDTFESFLCIENMNILAYASVDFIKCIFYLIRNSPCKIIDYSNTENQNEIFIVFLKFLQRFSKILRSINELNDESFINFHLKIKKTRFIDIEKIRESFDQMDPEFIFDGLNFTSNNKESLLIDRTLPLWQIWFIFLEEYSLTICSSHLEFRPMLMEVYFTFIKIILDMNEQMDFSIYCFNHIDLPMMQYLLRQTLINNDTIDEHYIFLKSWLPMFIKYIIKFILYDNHNEMEPDQIDNELIDEDGKALKPDNRPFSPGIDHYESRNTLLKQTLLILIECLNEDYHDLISILSLSLMKYLLLSLNQVCSTDLWKIIIDYFKLAHQVTLYPLKMLMNSFENIPNDFDVDLERIKLMTIRNQNQSHINYNYVQKRSQQIFIINGNNKVINTNPPSITDNQKHFNDNCFYTIIVETSTGIQQSTPYHILILQLHNHLILLQIISSLLTFNVQPDFTELVPFFFEDVDEMCPEHSKSNIIPLLKLQTNQFIELCQLFKQSFQYSIKFDSRVGLKYLLRHICHLNLLPNLYKISTLVWSTQFAVNYYLCSHLEYRNDEFMAALEELFLEISQIYIERNRLMGNILKQKQTSMAIDSRLITSDLFVQSDQPDTNTDMDRRIYHLATASKVSTIQEAYEKRKHQQMIMNNNPMNQRINTENSNEILARAMVKANVEFLENDLQLFIQLWNNITDKCIELHLICNDNTFSFMLPQYRKLIKTLLKNGLDRHSSDAILNWIDKLSEHYLKTKIQC